VNSVQIVARVVSVFYAAKSTLVRVLEGIAVVRLSFVVATDLMPAGGMHLPYAVYAVVRLVQAADHRLELV
jgi:hypothetical protein